MSGKVAPNIVTNGLVLHLDAANPSSYSPQLQPFTWYDLSANKGVGGLGNFSPTSPFDPANGGSISFDGVNDFAQGSYIDGSEPISITVQCWVYNNDSAAFSPQNIFRYGNGTTQFNPSYGLGWFSSRFLAINSNGGTSIGIGQFENKWLEITFVFSSDGNTYFYANGDLNDTLAMAKTQRITNIWTLGRTHNAFPYNGKIAIVRVYNRALSASEIEKNYIAVKARFGL